MIPRTESSATDQPSLATDRALRATSTAAPLAAGVELDHFVHSVAHDLRGPLMHIGGFAEMLAAHARGQLDETGREYLQTIVNSVGQLERMLIEVVARTRLSRGEATLRSGSASGLLSIAAPPEETENSSDTPGGVPSAGALRVLLVEDSAPDVALIKHMLLKSGREISVTNVATRAAFEAELALRPPHLILSDYSLPTFDGSAALEIAKRLAPQIPFIFVM